LLARDDPGVLQGLPGEFEHEPLVRIARRGLAGRVFRGSAQARELDERIEEFGRDSVTTGLHALPAGPA
jgi:hypothetical protein